MWAAAEPTKECFTFTTSS